MFEKFVCLRCNVLQKFLPHQRMIIQINDLSDDLQVAALQHRSTHPAGKHLASWLWIPPSWFSQFVHRATATTSLFFKTDSMQEEFSSLVVFTSLSDETVFVSIEISLLAFKAAPPRLLTTTTTTTAMTKPSSTNQWRHLTVTPTIFSLWKCLSASKVRSKKWYFSSTL